jgi:CheY-like chemotaxis protein
MDPHRLLVVDDHEETRLAFRGLFARLGWEVHTARSVDEGLALLETEPEPCCLLLDLDLPDGHGETVLERVREKNLRTRVVVSTGSMDQARLTLVAGLKPDALLTKPITMNDVWHDFCRVCESGDKSA